MDVSAKQSNNKSIRIIRRPGAVPCNLHHYPYELFPLEVRPSPSLSPCLSVWYPSPRPGLSTIRTRRQDNTTPHGSLLLTAGLSLSLYLFGKILAELCLRNFVPFSVPGTLYLYRNRAPTALEKPTQAVKKKGHKTAHFAPFRK